MIEPRRIHQALTLSKHRNFARAAAVLGMTQPALTRSIQVLEEELGVRLFDRLPRDVVPTEYGKVLLERGEPILGALRELQGQLDSLRGLESGTLSVGVGPALIGCLMGPALGRFASRHPGVPVRLTEDHIGSLARALRAGEIEMFVAYIGDHQDDPGFDVIPLGAHRGLFYARVDYPLAGRRKVTLPKILEFPVAGPRLPRGIVEQIFDGTPLQVADHPLPTVECRSFEAAKSMVRAGNVVGYAPVPLVATGLRSGELVDIRFPLGRLEGQAGIVTLQGHSLSPAAAALVAEVQELDRGLGIRLQGLSVGVSAGPDQGP